jgi:flagellum-specific peptidoglycan hydrolase FlgJ
MTLVAATRTPFDGATLIAQLGVAYQAQMGHEPQHHTLAVLCAQVALETANGASCICNNIGNIKRGPGPDYCSFQTTEWEGTPPAPVVQVCEFSAWPDLASACQFYIAAMASHWPEAWSAAVAGDVPGFAHGLKVRGYFTAPEAQYAAGVARWFEHYMALLGGDVSVTQPAPVSPEDAAVEATDGLDVRASYSPDETLKP